MTETRLIDHLCLGLLLRFDGSEWSSEETGTTETLNAVHGSSANNVFAVGENGTILHRCGAGW